jgi:hypothetical protein
MWIVDVRRPSLDSETMNVAGPIEVRRRKDSWMDMVWG